MSERPQTRTERAGAAMESVLVIPFAFLVPVGVELR
jgi:hypothetical protein